MENLSEVDREKALKATIFLCIRELQDSEPEEQGAQELGFGSVEAMRIQLNNWGVPDRITRDRRFVEVPKRPKLEGFRDKGGLLSNRAVPVAALGDRVATC